MTTATATATTTNTTEKPVIPDRVFIGNIAYDATEQSLRDSLKDYQVAEITLPHRRNDANRHFGFAFVHFSTVEQADLAVAQLNHTDVAGRKIFVRKAVAESSPEEKAKNKENSRRKSRNKKTNGDAGEKGEGAEEEKEREARPKKALKPKREKREPLGIPSKDAVFVTNLTTKTTSTELMELFEELNPKSARVPQRHVPGRVYRAAKAAGTPLRTLSRSFAFVIFDTEKDQRMAIEKFNGHEFNGKQIGVDVAFLPHEQDKQEEDEGQAA